MSAQPTTTAWARPDADLYLASRSPRRRQLLEQLGLRPLVVSGDVDETPLIGEAPADYVARIAAAKAHAAWAALPAAPAVPLLAADTSVIADGRPLGKPVDSEAALSMLALLSGRTHEVLTAVTLLARGGEGLAAPRERHLISRTEVRMRAIAPGEALAYWETGEPRGKAGAYAIQGLGAVFVESLNGSYSNVVGLPLYETAALLREQGIAILET
jgi:septum formation protein